MKVEFSPPDITELEIQEVADALRSGWITTGKRTKRFEDEIARYCGTEKSVCLNSATAALELTLRILGIGPGDEVITSAYTYTATVSVICHVGARPVLVDVKKDSYEMDYDQVEQAITEKTKAIIPVDLGGILCDYDRIFSIVEQKKPIFIPRHAMQEKFNRIIVIADAAHAFGATRKGLTCGNIADFTCFSFHAVKNLTTGEGGAVTWRHITEIDSDALYRQYMLYSLHGQSKDALAKTQLGAWEYDIMLPGYKCNMTDVTAAIGLVQLARYPEMLEKRRKIISRYLVGLGERNLQFAPHYTSSSTSSGHLFLVRMEGQQREIRDRVIQDMASKGISTNVHYKPLPMHTAYRRMGFSIDEYPNSYRQFENEITLPLHTKLTDEEVEFVIDEFTEIIQRIGL
ncbi:DegT/DnrJ/EryC1/StrS family aminotransferase [Bianquea renquensis]|jgi:putative capsular polysaccharide biosynthesis protein|uniref:DegT/DnrJ/EryC1/StrS family aminotransferase n=1 Tax=Bianquea renquensis TaxID=2763661 RepID=A0A926DRD4_9FIRM|nr:DegT/DnrJ/EryC1/StrS family aminotransferase [Bianquea renquensis]MBC8542412.1 DegT/DnrJ/EryC1/StrS family aminotransferase [Bianquea renquensis]